MSRTTTNVKGWVAWKLRDAGWELIHAGDGFEGNDLTTLDNELNTGYRLGFAAGRRSQGGYEDGRQDGRREVVAEMHGRGHLRPVE